MEAIKNKTAVAERVRTYDRYKDSGVEWLGEIPEHWDVKKLKYIGSIYSGLGGKKGDDFAKEFSHGLKPFIHFTNICNNQKILEDHYQYVRIDENEYQNRVRNKDILFLMSSETLEDIAKCSIYLGNDKELYLNSFCKGFRIRESSVFPEYINYLLLSKSYRNYFGLVGRGFTGINVKQEYINDVSVTIPSLNEQTAIAQFLDDKTTKIDQAIGIKEQQISLLKERKQILIHNAVTKGIRPLSEVKMKDSGVEWIGEIPEEWEVKRLKNVCYINQKALPDTTNKDFEFRYVDIGSVNLEDGIVQTEKYLFKNSPSRARRIAKPGDTIISTVRTYLKAIDFVNEEKSKYIYSTGFAVLQPETFIYPEFLANFVRSDAFTEQVTVNSKGMSYPAINSTDLSRLFVVHSNIEEQKEISEHIESASQRIDTAISLKLQEIEKLKEYKSSLINSVVTGKVRVS